MTGAQVIRVPAFKAEATERQWRWSRICTIGGVGLIILGISSCTWSNWVDRAQAGKDVVQPVAQTTAADPKTKIAPLAVQAMTREAYAKTYAKLGKAQFSRANELASWAAMAAASDAACERVDLVGISGAATRSNLVWYINCTGGTRLFIDQAAAEAARARHVARKGA